MKFSKILALSALLTLGGLGASTPSSADNMSVMQCSSFGGSFARCYLNPGDRITQAQLDTQYSSDPCQYGRSWGYDYDSIWVDRGCRGSFRIWWISGGGGGGGGSSSWKDVRCKSGSYNYKECRVGRYIYDVQLIKQHSDADCNRGRTWGYQDDFIWVDEGCEATFRVYM